MCVLAEDIGETAGCGARLTALRRTASGPFRIEDAVTLDACAEAADEARDALLLPAASLPGHLPVIRLAAQHVGWLRQGRSMPSTAADGSYRCETIDHELIGTGAVEAGTLRAVRPCRIDDHA